MNSKIGGNHEPLDSQLYAGNLEEDSVFVNPKQASRTASSQIAPGYQQDMDFSRKNTARVV